MDKEDKFVIITSWILIILNYQIRYIMWLTRIDLYKTITAHLLEIYNVRWRASREMTSDQKVFDQYTPLGMYTGGQVMFEISGRIHMKIAPGRK